MLQQCDPQRVAPSQEASGRLSLATTSIPRDMTIRDFLQRSSATAAFQDAVNAFTRSGAPNDRVSFDAYSPPVKVERTLTKMLEVYPELAIDRVEIRGASG